MIRRPPAVEPTDPEVMTVIAQRRHGIYALRVEPGGVIFDASLVDATIFAEWYLASLVATVEGIAVVPTPAASAGHVAVPVEDIGKAFADLRTFTAEQVLNGECPGARVTHLDDPNGG